MMPFSHANQNIIDTCNSILTHKKTEKFAPLQVQKISDTYYFKYGYEKRALSWTFCCMEGSLSLEAAMCLSLFLFLCLCLMMPMKMMDRQRQIQAVMESVGEELSQYAYVEYCFHTGDGETVDIKRSDGAEAGSLLASGYAAARILTQIDSSWIDSVSFEGTDIGTDDMVRIVMNYRMKLPFTVLGLDSIPVRQVCSRRMWSGADGGRGPGMGASGEKQEEIVYIGKNSTRYHMQRTCHYLYNDLEPVTAGEIDLRRNQAGARYYPCQACGAGPGSGTVYIMPYGTSYHTIKSCSAIIAYVQAVPLPQVEYLGACSYCGGK